MALGGCGTAVLVAVSVAASVFLAAPVYAQVDQMASLSRSSALVGSGGEGMGGAKVGEGLYLKLGVVAEAGYDSNVYYSDTNKVDSPTVQITPRAVLSNDNREGQAPPMRFSLAAALLYREYLSNETDTATQRVFNPTFTGSLAYVPSESVSLAAMDQFARLEDAPYTVGQPVIQRSFNTGSLDLRVTPGGGRLQNELRYTNSVDIFETDSAAFANRMTHDLMLSAAYKWLPKTSVYLEGGIGYVQYLDAQRASAQFRENSIPYRIVAGIRGLVSPKVSVNLGFGYDDFIYTNDIANPTGTSNLLARASLNYNPVTLTNFQLGYEHKIVDSPFVGNFYDSDAAAAALSQQLGAFVLRAFYLFEHRRYQGKQQDMTETARRDNLHRAGVQADYYLQRWFFAGVGYSAQINRSSGESTALGQTPLDYTKQVILGRVGINY